MSSMDCYRTVPLLNVWPYQTVLQMNAAVSEAPIFYISYLLIQLMSFLGMRLAAEYSHTSRYSSINWRQKLTHATSACHENAEYDRKSEMCHFFMISQKT